MFVTTIKTTHSHQFGKYRGEGRKVKVADLLTKQQTLLQPSAAQKNATQASYRISNITVRSGRAFAVGDFGKAGLAIAAESVSNSNAGFFSDQPVTEQGPAVWGRVTQRASQFSVSLSTVAGVFGVYSALYD